jgi:hypothetical protein
MPQSQTTYVKTVGDWELLLAAVAEHAPSLTDVEDLRVGLEQLLAQARTLKARQDTARANRQRNTQELKAVLEQGRDYAMRIRALSKARLGPKNESVVRFGVAPLRKRSPRARPAEPVPPTEPPAPSSPPAALPLAKGGEPPRS